jgi:hypothetical protein
VTLCYSFRKNSGKCTFFVKKERFRFSFRESKPFLVNFYVLAEADLEQNFRFRPRDVFRNHGIHKMDSKQIFMISSLLFLPFFKRKKFGRRSFGICFQVFGETGAMTFPVEAVEISFSKYIAASSLTQGRPAGRMLM